MNTLADPLLDQSISQLTSEQEALLRTRALNGLRNIQLFDSAVL